jgi:hypothetical protein
MVGAYAVHHAQFAGDGMYGKGHAGKVGAFHIADSLIKPDNVIGTARQRVVMVNIYLHPQVMGGIKS